MGNTIFSFMYRDADNYKIRQEAVLEGSMPEGAEEKIREAIIEREFFYPKSLGIAARDFVDEGYRPYDDDPEWFEFCGVNPTDKAPTEDVTAEQVYQMILGGVANKPKEEEET